jgi:hypothetical protein
VLKPLTTLSGCGGRRQRRSLQPVIIVVDALDECDSERDIAAVLGLLALGAQDMKSRSLRVLLTSHPETHIRYGIHDIQLASLERLVLHDLKSRDVDCDIRSTSPTIFAVSVESLCATLTDRAKRQSNGWLCKHLAYLSGQRQLISSSAAAGRLPMTDCMMS